MDDAYRDVRALVLGASGFIGAWTVRALQAQGAEVIAVFRDGARGAPETLGPLASAIRVVSADLSRPGEASRLVVSQRPDVVFNLAGYGVDRSERDPALMAALNAALVRELCAALAETPASAWEGARLIHAGSALEYGRLSGMLRETDVENPTTDYGRTKLEGTRFLTACCAASGLKAVVARLFTVYGPGEHFDRLLPALMRTARTGLRLGLTGGTQRRNFTYVEDVAEGLTRLGTSAVSGNQVVNLGVERLVSVREFADTAAAVLGFDRNLLVFGALPDREDEMWHGEVDVTRLRTLTSWLPPTPIADGIRRSWEFSHAE